MSMSHDKLHIHPQFKPWTTYYNNFFLFRTAIAINSQLAEISGSVGTGELTLSCRYPRFSVTMDSVFTEFTPILKKHGVDVVPNYWCDSEVPLFGVSFSSQHGLKKLLERREKVDAELAAALSRTFSEYSLAPTLLVNVHSEVFQIIPDVATSQAQVIKVTLDNYMTCMTKWKESEVFRFSSLFQEHRIDLNEIIAQGTVALKDLLNELSEVVNWFQMGVHLEVPEGVLMKIEHDYRTVDRCVLHMLMTRQDQKELTWSDIVRALEMIKMRGLAQKIAVKYGVALSHFSHDLANEGGSLEQQELFAKVEQLQKDIEAMQKEKVFAEQTIAHLLQTVDTKTTELMKEKSKIIEKQLATKELEGKSAQVRELEGTISELRSDVEGEKRRVDMLLTQMTAATTSKEQHIREIEKPELSSTLSERNLTTRQSEDKGVPKEPIKGDEHCTSENVKSIASKSGATGGSMKESVSLSSKATDVGSHLKEKQAGAQAEGGNDGSHDVKPKNVPREKAHQAEKRRKTWKLPSLSWPWFMQKEKNPQYRPYTQESTHTKMAMVEPPQTLVLTASKPFMHSESELATFDPSQQTSPTGALDSRMMDRLKPILIINFPQHVHEMHQDRDKEFEHEYQSVSNEPLASHDIARLPYNRAKNRFNNIFPYDFSRVKLQEIAGVVGSDYINACSMDGYNHPNAYIAAQGPMPNNIADFWRMVWEHKLVTVVMLTKCVEAGKRKCEMYWPESVNETLQPGANISVTLISQMPFADYEIKKFTVQDISKPDTPPLTVTHFHFLGWPDYGVPKFATSLIAFIRRVRKGHNRKGAPMLVHCSAGVGRTGTFILLDSMLESMKVEDSVRVYEFLCDMRARRVFMVQTLAQYVFIHDALEELITSGKTDISATNLRVKVNRLNKIIPGKAIDGFDNQFRLLDQVSRRANDTDCSDALQHYNKHKNRYPDRVPYNRSRARLRPTGTTGGEYINASFVDGYKQRNAYIATQAPLEATVNDFWRMIWEFKSKVIVMLCSLEENGHEACYPYWPVKQGEIGVYGKLQVTLQSEEPGKDFTVRKFEIKEEKAQQPTQRQQAGFVVTQLCHNHWPEHGCPTSTISILKMIDHLIKVQRNTGNRSITVICNDGMGRTGTFICIHSQLERVKTEGVVDFFQYIKSARIHRPSLVSELVHYIFCHDTLADYLDSFDTYANFKDLGAQ